MLLPQRCAGGLDALQSSTAKISLESPRAGPLKAFVYARREESADGHGFGLGLLRLGRPLLLRRVGADGYPHRIARALERRLKANTSSIQ